MKVSTIRMIRCWGYELHNNTQQGRTGNKQDKSDFIAEFHSTLFGVVVYGIMHFVNISSRLTREKNYIPRTLSKFFHMSTKDK